MAVQIAKPRDMMMRDPLKGPMYQPNPTQQPEPEPTATKMLADAAQQKAVEETVNFGAEKVGQYAVTPAKEALTGMFSSAAPTAASTIGSTGMGSPLVLGAEAGMGATAGTGALTALGTAVPYIGAGILAGKALGFFNEGGQVGPLSELQIEPGEGSNAFFNDGNVMYGSGELETRVRQGDPDAIAKYREQTMKMKEIDRVTDIIRQRNDLSDEEKMALINKVVNAIRQSGYYDEGGQVEPTYANMGKMIMSGGLGPLAMKKMKEEGMPMGMGLASMLSEGGEVRGVEQQLETGKRQDMSKGPLGLLNMFVKGVDALTGYDRANEKRADLPEGKVDPEAIQLGHGGMAGPLSKIEYKSAGGETYKLSYGGPISKGA